MAIPKKNLQDLKSIRGHSGRPGMAGESHRVYMRITFLEMEKARQNKVRDNSIRLLNTIDARIKEIEEEKKVLLKIGDAESKPTGFQVPESFKIKY